MGQMVQLRAAQKQTHTTVDTIEVTPDVIKKWKKPPFQRPVRENTKVLALVEELKDNGGVFPGVLTIGKLGGDEYIVDGQHRVHAFVLAELKEGYADVRYKKYGSMAEMADDFVELNSSLVKMRPDDILRGLESSSEALQYIRKNCAYVGYDQIRRGTASPIIGMSQLLRCWVMAGHDVPAGGQSKSATDAVKTLSLEDAQRIVSFLDMALKAWGRDPEYAKLWGGLNFTICMWLYRRMVLQAWSARVPKLTKDSFTKCMQSLSTSVDYLDFLVGRQLNERDRSPAYRRIKAAFSKRLEQETGKKVAMPQPEWAAH